MISKNAVTFLKRAALYGSTGEWPTDFQMTHNLIGRDEKSHYLIPVEEMPQWEAEHGRRVKFAVYRDPIRRLESCYTLFCLDGVYTRHMDRAGMYRDPSERHFRDFLRFEMTKEPGWIEEHFRPQSEYYSPSDVDAIIDIHDVQPFLAAHDVPFVSEKSNASIHSHRFTDPEFLEEIKHYYRKDFSITPLPCNEALTITKDI